MPAFSRKRTSCRRRSRAGSSNAWLLHGALANDPPVILAYEPTGNLDSYTSDTIFRLFGELAAAGKTVVMVTHERYFLAPVNCTVELADCVVIAPEA